MKCARAGCEKQLNQSQVRTGDKCCSVACAQAVRHGYGPKPINVNGYNMDCVVCGKTHDARVAIEQHIEIGVCSEQCAVRFSLTRREHEKEEVAMWRKLNLRALAVVALLFLMVTPLAAQTDTLSWKQLRQRQGYEITQLKNTKLALDAAMARAQYLLDYFHARVVADSLAALAPPPRPPADSMSIYMPEATRGPDGRYRAAVGIPTKVCAVLWYGRIPEVPPGTVEWSTPDPNIATLVPVTSNCATLTVLTDVEEIQLGNLRLAVL